LLAKILVLYPEPTLGTTPFAFGSTNGIDCIVPEGIRTPMWNNMGRIRSRWAGRTWLWLLLVTGTFREDIHRDRAVVTLPGYFRPTKLWDLLVVHQGRLVAALELKSQVGPSFGNNFNNRTEEAIGTAHDLWTAYREGAFGKQPRPFVGWLMLVEDAPASRTPVRDRSQHFPVFREFQGASYLKRYDILCQRLAQEQLYTTAALLASSREAVMTGEYSALSEMTNLKTFVTSLAGHIATEAARTK
jgi:hypothetical protein